MPFDTFDIEDLYKLGKEHQICPYFLQKQRSSDADLVLMPYNYLIDDRIRTNYKINYENSVIIFDEGHNINKISEEVASFELSIHLLKTVLTELNGLAAEIEMKSDIKKFKSEINDIEQ